MTVIVRAGVNAVSYCELPALWDENECKRAIAPRKHVGRERIERTRRRYRRIESYRERIGPGVYRLPLGVKPDAAKLSVSVIVPALVVFMAPALSATAQFAVNKAKDFIAVGMLTANATQPCAAGGASQLDVVVVDARALVVVVPMPGCSAPKLAIA
jgi:hypothetical protein